MWSLIRKAAAIPRDPHQAEAKGEHPQDRRYAPYDQLAQEVRRDLPGIPCAHQFVAENQATCGEGQHANDRRCAGIQETLQHHSEVK